MRLPWETSYVIRIALETGLILPQQVTFSGRINVIKGSGSRFFVGGHCQKGLVASYDNVEFRRTPKAKPGQPPSENGNACFALFDLAQKVVRGWMLDGSASSGVDDLFVAADGHLYVVGGFGGYPQDLDATFDLGKPTQKSLLNYSADDDPVYDVYVAKLNPQFVLVWAKAIMAYHNSINRFGKVVPWKQGVLVYVHTDWAFPIWFDKGSANEQKIDSSALVALGPTGQRKAVFLVEGVNELLPTEEGLLVAGRHYYPETFGKKGELAFPNYEKLGLEQKRHISYLLALDHDLEIKRFSLGGWLSANGRVSDTHWRIHSRQKVWIFTSATSTFTVDQGLKTMKSFGALGQSGLYLFPWVLGEAPD